MHHLLIRCSTRLHERLRGQSGQTSAEYALVLLGAASIALLIAFWAKDTGKVGDLLDAMFDQVTGLAD